MKYYFLILATLFVTLSFSQSDTEIFLYDIERKQSKFEFKNGKNISNNVGYDNQPSFLKDGNVIFSSNRDDQTDIVQYFPSHGSKVWLNYTDAGEYSPAEIPNKNAVSAIRLDLDGKQRLFSYGLTNGKSSELINDIVVAYYTWYNENNIVSAVIEGENLNLYVTDLKAKKNRKYDTRVGRSIHKIPNSNLVSFVSKKNTKQWQIKSLDPITGEIKLLANTIDGVEDICWLNNRTLLSSKGNSLYKLTLKRDNNWRKVADLSNQGITKISRLSVNKSGTKLLLVAEGTDGSISSDIKTPEALSLEQMNRQTALKNSQNTVRLSTIIQKQLDAYNAKDVDAFLATYSEDVKLYNYPTELLSEGKDQLRKDHVAWFKNTADLEAIVKKRIVIGNKVIDEEQVTANGKIFITVAIYEIENGLIQKVTFIQ